MSGHIPHFREQRPIFVGASARRLRGLRTAGAMVLVSGVGFVGVLLIALIGGLLVPSLVLPFAAPPKTVVSPVHPQPPPQPETSTTTEPLRLSVAQVDSTRQLSGLAPPRAASPLSKSKRRPPNATVKVAAEYQRVPKRRPVMVAKATPQGMAEVKRRPVVAALVTAKGQQAVRLAAKRRPSTSAARVIAKGRPVVVSGKVTAKRRPAVRSARLPAASGATVKGRAVANAGLLEPPRSNKVPAGPESAEQGGPMSRGG